MSVAVVALQTFIHGSLSAKAGGVYHLPDKLSEDLMRAGLIKYATIAQAKHEKKTTLKPGKDSTLPVLPADLASRKKTAKPLDIGDRLRRNRGELS